MLGLDLLGLRVSQVYRRIFASCGLSFCLSFAAVGKDLVCESQLYRLGSYAFVFAQDRELSAIEFWKKYKAQERLQDFDLREISTYPIRETMPWYERLVLENKLHPRSPRPSEYELTLLAAGHSSRLKFRSGEIELGAFLGAGNAAHIYQLANEPGVAVRLAFAADAGPIYQRSSRMEQAQELIELYRRKRPNTDRIQVVKILDSDPAEPYVLVEYIDTTVNAFEFFQKISSQAELSEKEQEMLALLIENYSFQSGVLLRLNPAVTQIPAQLRQWGWSESRGNWVLLDWE